MVDLLVWVIFGLFVGAIARLLVPGRDPMGCLGTILLGVAGSVVGGFLASLLFGGLREGFRPAGFLGALIGGVIVLLIWRRFRGEPR
ncbi:MAG: GlsB/YeaQ/YmgE family stress response membrane protein [Pirellulales bacterium]|nr:GlsB/YeaQ/YmgE family stress response membrane protein [Pirellulales bacterium]